MTFIRFPGGVGGQQGLREDLSNGTPDWLSIAPLPATRSRFGCDAWTIAKR
ncbi:hypothetical protein [Amycolatopsis sp. NPDC003731]